MDGVLNRIEEIQKLNKYEDINHPEKLDLYRNVINKKFKFINHNLENKIKYFWYFESWLIFSNKMKRPF